MSLSCVSAVGIRPDCQFIINCYLAIFEWGWVGCEEFYRSREGVAFRLFDFVTKSSGSFFFYSFLVLVVLWFLWFSGSCHSHGSLVLVVLMVLWFFGFFGSCGCYPFALVAWSPAIGTACDLSSSISRWWARKKFVLFRILKKGFPVFHSHSKWSFYKVLSSGSIFLGEIKSWHHQGAVVSQCIRIDNCFDQQNNTWSVSALQRKGKLVLHCCGAIRVQKITRVPSQVYWSHCGTLGS